MKPSTHNPTQIACAALAVFLSGCSSLRAGAPPLRVPALAVEARHQLGSSLTGPLAAPVPADSAAPFGVRQRGLWVEAPIPVGQTLDRFVGLVIGPADSDPLRPVPRRAGSVGFVRGPEATELVRSLAQGGYGRTTQAWEEQGTLSPGTTFRLKASTADGTGDSVSFLLDASRAGEPLEARIALQLGLRGDSEGEKVLLAEPLRPADGPIAFVFQRAAREDEPSALVVLVEATTDAAGGDDSSSTRGEFEASAAAASERSREITRSEEERREIRGVLSDLDRPLERRARLVFLASSCGAPLALDIALIAQDADLAELATAVRAAIPENADRAAAAWPIERAAWILLGQKAAAGAIAPELSGVLARQGGEAARFPGAIEDLVHGLRDVQGLTQRLVAENRILLEDASPSSRLRAYDWLAARGLAPTGYDPFGSLADRRAALRKLAEAEEAAAQSAGKPR
ncbi:MAG: hypothetical protein NTY35_02975 [Planctomycetota bacterium]|nr:hypothetical protein [Planctomycetota bacterium]